MRIKLFMIALLSIFMMSCSDQVDLPTDTQEETQASKSYLDRASESNTLANKINESIASISRTGESTYPEDFGGLYIDSDGYLVILTTGDFTNSRSAISTVISDSELVRYKACKYSYQDLLNATYEIDQALSTASKKIADNFVGYALMTEDNSVMVMLEDISDAAITDFRQSVYDHPCLTFVKGERINLHASLTLGSEAIIKSISEFNTEKSIVLANVDFKYNPHAFKKTLTDVSAITKGKVTAIVGALGSEKTTVFETI